MGLHTVTAALDVTEAELEVIKAMAKACGVGEGEFLGQCLARGLVVVAEEYHDTRMGVAAGDTAGQFALEDDLPI